MVDRTHQDIPPQKISGHSTDEGIARGDTLRFTSFIYHSIEDFEVVKSLKGFLPNLLPLKVMTILLNFQPIPRCLPKNKIT
jgi:hypothetical protein